MERRAGGAGTGAAAERGRILRAAWVMSAATALSRVLGLVRDSVIAALFGAGGSLDAFLVAFRIPNLLRSLLAEGSLTISFVPIFVETQEREGREKADALGRTALTLLLLVLAATVVCGLLFAPFIVKLMALGFSASPEKFDLTVDLTRIVFPFIGFVGITALFGGILNARGVFLYPALAPVALNVATVAATLALFRHVSPPVAAVAYGVLLGGVCQLLLQVGPLKRTGFPLKLSFDWRNPALKKVLLLLGPSVFGVAVYQLNIVVSTALASWLPDGSVSFLYYAERVFQLPLGIFAVSVGVASLPSLSRLAAREEWEGFGETVRGSLRLLLFVVLPATAGLLALAEPIVALLFQRGKFDAAMVQGTALAVSFYALALLPVAATRVVVQGFYALKDTRTPVWAAFWSFWVNLAVSLALMGPLKHGGLALATALSAAFNTLYLCFYYRKRMGRSPFASLYGPLARMAAASAFMGGAVLFSRFAFAQAATGKLGQVALGVFVFGTILAGIFCYGLAAKVLGLHELEAILRRVFGKREKTA